MVAVFMANTHLGGKKAKSPLSHIILGLSLDLH